VIQSYSFAISSFYFAYTAGYIQVDCDVLCKMYAMDFRM